MDMTMIAGIWLHTAPECRQPEMFATYLHKRVYPNMEKVILNAQSRRNKMSSFHSQL